MSWGVFSQIHPGSSDHIKGQIYDYTHATHSHFLFHVSFFQMGATKNIGVAHQKHNFQFYFAVVKYRVKIMAKKKEKN